MTAMAFDTLKLARALRDKANFTPEQAEGAADAIAEAIQTDLSTRADLIGVKSELLASIADAKAEVIKWVAGIVGFQTLAVIGTVLALAHH
jgi:RNA-binding protein YhbY